MPGVILHQLQQYNRSPMHCGHLRNSQNLVHLKPNLVVLRKYLIELKLFCFLKIVPEVAQNCLSFPCSYSNSWVLQVFQVVVERLLTEAVKLQMWSSCCRWGKKTGRENGGSRGTSGWQTVEWMLHARWGVLDWSWEHARAVNHHHVVVDAVSYTHLTLPTILRV